MKINQTTLQNGVFANGDDQRLTCLINGQYESIIKTQKGIF